MGHVNKRLFSMSYNQMKKEKKKSLYVCISMVLCLLILIFVYSCYHSLDLDKFLKNYLKSDFMIASSDYFNMKYDEKSENVDESLIHSIEQEEGFVDGGGLYYFSDRQNCLIQTNEKETVEEGLYDENGNAYLDLYGADDFFVDKMEVYKGSIDKELLKTGKYIIYGVGTDDYGNVSDTIQYNVGDKVEISVNGKTKTYEVLAIIKMETDINTVRVWSKLYSMYLPAEEYIELTQTNGMMSYMFDVDKVKVSEFDKLLESYTNINDEMEYASKKVYMDEFKDMQVMLKMIGIFLTIVIGTIALMNFCNLIITEIISRQHELAILQAIGMTNFQMFIMLIIEGSLYGIISIIMALVFGSAISLIVLKNIVNSIWFCTYHFSVFPILVISPFILLFTLLIPTVTYFFTSKKDISERIKSNY